MDDATSLQSFFDLVQKCDELRTLSWSYKGAAGPLPSTLKIDLPELISLNVELKTPTLLLGRFVAASLENLRIYLPPHLGLNFISPAWMRDHTLFPNLRTLSLAIKMAPANLTSVEEIATYSAKLDRLLRFIHAHPNLEYVDLPFIIINSDLAESFGSTQSPHFTLTKLKRLNIQFDVNCASPINQLLRLRRLGRVSSPGLPLLVVGCYVDRHGSRKVLNKLAEKFPNVLEYLARGMVGQSYQKWLRDHGFETYGKDQL